MQRTTPVRLLWTLGVTLVAMPHIAFGCSGPESKSLHELLEESTSIVIARVEGERISERSISPEVFPEVIANVRVVEVLMGANPSLKSITYIAHGCGGHRLSVGSYYVVVLSGDDENKVLSFEDRSVLGLGDEYSEQETSTSSRSLLLMNLRNFKQIGRFPETFNVEPFFALVRDPIEWPSTNPRW